MAEFVCPVGGFAGLRFAPWRVKALPAQGNLELWRSSHEICPCCGIEFGRDDWAGGDLEKRAEVQGRWRGAWMKKGMTWAEESRRPETWNPQAQLERIGIQEQP